MDKDKEIYLDSATLTDRENKSQGLIVLNMPMGHVGMGVTQNAESNILIVFHEMENYHTPGTTMAKGEKGNPKFGMVFHSVESIRAVGNWLLKVANAYGGEKENAETGENE